VDAYNGCEGSLEECVILALTACRAGVVKVFVTDIIFNGNLGGLAGADTECTDAATAANPPLPGTWTAWLSDNSADARDRIRDGGYQLLDGTVIANDKADLTDGTLNAAINLNENLGTEIGGNVWTGTNTEGINFEGSTCQQWSTNEDTVRGRPGRLTEVDAFWTDIDGGNTCDKSLHLYCLADATSD
jgi:hypothetical protein